MRVVVKNSGEAILDLERELTSFQRSAIQNHVHDFAIAVQRRAVLGIERGPASGNVYPSSVTPNRSHQASSPGEYPMSDSGALSDSIHRDLQPQSASVFSNLEYARYLELKPPERGGRPWLSRAFNEELASRGW